MRSAMRVAWLTSCRLHRTRSRAAIAVDRAEEVQDLSARHRVEAGDWLVGQQDGRIMRRAPPGRSRPSASVRR